MKKKTFRAKLDFKKSEFGGTIDLNISGINTSIATPAVLHHEYAGFNTKGFQMGSLFSSMNDPKYYEGTTAADIIPKEEDFIEVTFRLISATTVGAGSWKATDFTNVKALKDSMEKLNGKPIYKDHETDLDNWVGIVKGTRWSPEAMENGSKIPAGIDGLMLIDAKTNPKIARGLLIGSIFSNSVTVDFEWEMSHQFENEYDFYDKVGTMGSDGKMIRRVVKSIYDYYETSLVWLGADPFAKARNADGNLVNVDNSGIYEYSKSEGLVQSSKVTYADLQEDEKEEFKNSKKLKINFALEKNIISLMRKEVPQENQDDMNKEFFLAFIATFGTDLELTKDTPEADVIEKMKTVSLMSEADKKSLQLGNALVTAAQKVLGEGKEVTEEFVKTHAFVDATELASLKTSAAELVTAKADLTTLKTEKTALEADAKIGKEYSTKKVDEAKKLYKLTVGEGKADESVLALFDKAAPAEVEGLLKSYAKGATERFSGKCADCGSEEFKFQSTFSSGTKEDDGLVGDGIVTTEDFREKHRQGAFTIGRNTGK